MQAVTAGGLALIAGLYTRVAAIALIPILLGAFFTVHGHNGFFFNDPNGGWVYPAFWIVALVVQAMPGDRRAGGWGGRLRHCTPAGPRGIGARPGPRPFISHG